MKRVVIFMLMLNGAVLVFAQNPQAVIREISGTVELKRPGDADWTPAGIGDQIETATIVSTGFKSTALVAIGNSTLTVRPLTRLSLDELLIRNNTETVNIGLRSGRIDVRVNPPAGSNNNDFTVHSPNSSASVRGTEFSMDAVSIRVTEGTVRYEAATGAGGNVRVQVNAGQSTWVDTDSGRVVNPVIAAEQTRKLPVLPGQSDAVTDTDNSERPRQGILGLTIELESQD